MSTTYTIGTFKFDFASEATVVGNLATAKVKPAFTKALSFLPGSAAGKCDRLACDTFDLAGSASISFDFAGGTLTDPYGAAQATWARILAWAVVLDADPAAASLVIGGGATPVPIFDTAATAKTIYNGIGGAWAGAGGGEPGIVVGAGTADLLKLLNGDSTLHAKGSYCFIGRSL